MRSLLTCCLIALFAACTPNNVTEDASIKKYFDANRAVGTFGLFDNGQGSFTVYNTSRFTDSAYLPASTFKIVNSLIGLETGRASSDSMVIPWDGVKRDNPDWNRDLTMKEAFKYSAVPWFRELARRIGKDTMQKWLDTLGYAQRYKKFTITNNLDTFWLDNSAKITADEQLGLVKRLYFGQLPFQSRSQRIVKNMMQQESNANYSLSYKTGWGFTEKGHNLGWVVGWIEENRHPYFFVLQVEQPDSDFDMRTVRINMLKDILKHLGFMEGKK